MKDNYGNDYNVLSDNGLEKKENRTRIIKDRVMPLVRNEAAGTVAGIAGAGVGAGVGYGTRKALQKTRRYVNSTQFGVDLGNKMGAKGKEFASRLSANANNKYVLDRLRYPAKALFSKEYSKYRTLAAAASGAMALAPKFKEGGKIIDRTRTLQKKHMEAFGTEPNEMEYFQAANLNPSKKIHQSAYELFNTPDAMIKSKKRDVSLTGKINRNAMKEDNDNAGMYYLPGQLGQYHFSKYSSNYCDEIEKIASINSKINTVKKVIPPTGAVLGGLTAGGASGLVASKMIDDDDKHRKAKILASMGVGTLGGGVLGKSIGSDASGIIDGIHQKITNPKQEFKNEAMAFADKLKESVQPFYFRR